jgi:Protein of unknown function (DUF664)
VPPRDQPHWTVQHRGRVDEIVDEYRVALCRKRWETSRRNLADLGSDDIVKGRGARPVWALQLQVVRELAQHAGHGDILREQILASRSYTKPRR